MSNRRRREFSSYKAGVFGGTKIHLFEFGVKCLNFGATYLSLGAIYWNFDAMYLNFGGMYLNFGAKNSKYSLFEGCEGVGWVPRDLREV